MQATQVKGAKGVQWFGNHRLGSALLVVAMLVVGALAAIAASQAIDSSDTPGNSQPVIALKAHYVPQAGEGLLGGGSVVARERIKAYHVPEAGEGRVGAERLGDSAATVTERIGSDQLSITRDFPIRTADAEGALATDNGAFDAYLDMYFPGFERAEFETMTIEEIRFLEMNTQLPGVEGTVLRDPAILINPVVPYHRWHFLEMNMLPEPAVDPGFDNLDRWGMGVGPTAH